MHVGQQLGPADWAHIDALADRCVRSVLESVAEGAPPSHPTAPSERVWATIVLSGHLQGRAVVALTAAAVDATCPIRCAGNVDLARDWVCELTNLIIGQFRTELARHGVRLSLAPPRPMSPSGPEGAPCNAHAHEHSLVRGGFTLRLSFESGSVPLSNPSGPPSARRHELILF
jgi:hypothetical protein